MSLVAFDFFARGRDRLARVHPNDRDPIRTVARRHPYSKPQWQPQWEPRRRFASLQTRTPSQGQSARSNPARARTTAPFGGGASQTRYSCGVNTVWGPTRPGQALAGRFLRLNRTLQRGPAVLESLRGSTS